MERQTQPRKTPISPEKMSKLFRVLVVGGALLAAALASSAIRGGTGVAQADEGDGGVQGW